MKMLGRLMAFATVALALTVGPALALSPVLKIRSGAVPANCAAADEMLKTKGAELKDLNRRIDERRVQLGEVEARLAAAQEAVRKMLGGDA